MTNPIPNILVVDNEQHQLDTVCRGLSLHGYRGVGVQSVEKALELLRSGSEAISLVLTDITVHNAAGLRLVKMLKTEFPTIQIIVITGLQSSDAVLTIEQMNIPLLRKPFSPDKLAALISRTLNQ